MNLSDFNDIENYLKSGVRLRSKGGVIVAYFKDDLYLVRQKNLRYKVKAKTFFDLYPKEEWEVLEEKSVFIDPLVDEQYYQKFKHK